MSRVGDNIKKVRESSGMSARQLAKKMGVSESFLLDVESGRKVANEAMIQRFSKILGRNVSELGLDSFETTVFKEEKEAQRQTRVREARPVKAPVKAAPIKERSDVWEQAFGSTLKNVPIYSPAFQDPVGHKLYPIEDGRINGIQAEKAVVVRQDSDELKGYGIFRNSCLMGSPVKELVQGGYYLLSIHGRNLIRKVRLPGNANVLLCTWQEREISESVTLKDVKPLVQFTRMERDLK